MSNSTDDDKTVLADSTSTGDEDKTALAPGLVNSLDATVVSSPPADADSDATVFAQTANSVDPDVTQIATANVDPNATQLAGNTPGDATLLHQPNAKAASGGPASDNHLLKPGTVINNRFVIVKLLGEGGMGVVYRALDKRKEEARDREPHVAIKILSEDFRKFSQAFVALQREARKSQDLAHPNVITVYDFDREGDTFYMTMEELNGFPLDVLVKQNPKGFPVKQAENIVKGIAQGLAYAHSKSIVHSDLKPGNVFVLENGTVKILDLGIARAVSNATEGDDDHTLFDAGALGGLTPSYASNEMFLGKDPHPSDDIYALGVIAYQLYSGQHPFLRKPANKALQEGLRPTRLKNIKGHQWRAIASALELKRENRLPNAQQFLNKFEGVSRTVKGLVAAMIVTVAVSISLVVFMPADEGPEIPFEQLKPGLQTQITENLANAQQAMTFQDFNGALFHYNKAYELHPRNPAAVAGLDNIVQQIFDENNTLSLGETVEEKLKKTNTLLDYPSLANSRFLLELKEELEQNVGKAP